MICPDFFNIFFFFGVILRNFYKNSKLNNNLTVFYYFFVADYVSGGELFTHLYQREHFTEDQVRIYIGEIILALGHLHKVSGFNKIYADFKS